MDAIDVIDKRIKTKRPEDPEGFVVVKHFTQVLVQPKGSTRLIPCDYESGSTIEVGDRVSYVRTSKRYVVTSVFSSPKSVKVSDEHITGTGHILHSDIGGEFSTIVKKSSPFPLDRILIEDYEDSMRKKYMEISELQGILQDPVTIPPIATSWTLTNFSPATLVDDNHVLLMTAPAGAGDNLRIATIPFAYATPFTLDMLAEISWPDIDNTFTGIVLRDSGSGKVIGFGPTHSISSINIRAIKWDDATTYDSDYTLDFPPVFRSDHIWLRVEDDGVNFIFSISNNKKDYQPLLTVGDTDFLTPDELGFYVNINSGTSYNVFFRVKSWEIS